MFDLSQTLNFAVDEENLGAFDDLLACSKIEEIQYFLGQRKHLKEQEALKEKLTKLKDNLNYVLKEIESVGLSNEYNTVLDEVLNPDLKQKCKFPLIRGCVVERIERVKGINDSYVYYGQINASG